MKKLLLVIVVVLFGLSLVACDNVGNNKTGYDYDAIPDTMQSNDGKYQIAFVTDIGQLKDKSFNQGTWEGLKRFAHENEKSYKYYQPANADSATTEDRYNAMVAAVSGGADIIVCAGFMQGDALVKAATENPNVKFVFVDGWKVGLNNVTAIIFQEEQAGYLAGYAAVKDGYTKLGFAGGGGGANPACNRFGYGYLQGANAAAKELNITVNVNYSWLYGAGFSASQELQGMLNGWYVNGTEIVFACGGSMCLSAFAAASANNGKVIGVDVDQAAESTTVITSAMKGLREGTMYALEKFYNGKWSEIANVESNLGANQDAIGLPTEEASWGFKKFTVAEYEKLLKALKDGSVTVDAKTEGHETKTYSNLKVNFVEE